MMYFVIFFNSASVRLHNATYPLLLFYLWEGYPSVRYYSRIPYISLSSVFLGFQLKVCQNNSLLFISEVYWRGILFRHPSYFDFLLEGWVAVKGEKGIWRGFVGHFGWKLGMWQSFVKTCQRGQKNHIREIHFEGGGRKGNYFQVVPPDIVKPNLRQPTLTW